MLERKIFICGCSFSTGFYYIDQEKNQYGRHIPFGEILAESLGIKFETLAEPGASNYFISKQIEHSIKFKPDLVLINFTMPWRYDYIEKGKIYSFPTLEDFIYKFRSPISEKQPTIKSIAVNSLPDDSELKKLLSLYTTIHIKADQDRMMLSNALKELEKEKIKFLALDFSGFTYPGYFKNLNSLDIEYDKIFKTYHDKNDKSHLSQEGHNLIAQMIKPKIEEILK